MKNITKSDDGYYHVKGHKYELLIGSRAQVWHGTAYKTAGQLCKCDLFKNKHGRVVSKSKYESSKKEKRLLKYGYGFTKKKFVLQHKHSKKHRGRRHRGGGEDGEDGESAVPQSIGGTYSLPGKSLAANASQYKGGSIYGQSPGGVADNVGEVSSSSSSNKSYTLSGGKSRRKSRGCHCKHKICKHKKLRGGTYSISGNSVADNAEKWNPKWGNDKGNGLQQYASTFGGKSRRRHRKHKKSRGGYYAVSNISAQDAAPVNSSNGYSSGSSPSGTNNTSGPAAHSQKDSFTTSASY